MALLKKLVQTFLHYYPIKSNGPYKLVPLFFVMGGCMEWIMIKFPGAGAGETFYDVWRRKQSEKLYQRKLAEEQFQAINSLSKKALQEDPVLKTSAGS